MTQNENGASPDLVRFPNSLAFGSELDLHYPYRQGNFLSAFPAQPIVDENGQWGAYWISQHPRKPHAQSQRFSLTGLAASTPFLSSTSLPLLLEPCILHFPFFSLCISPRQVHIWHFLHQFATFAQRILSADEKSES